MALVGEGGGWAATKSSSESIISSSSAPGSCKLENKPPLRVLYQRSDGEGGGTAWQLQGALSSALRMAACTNTIARG